MAAQPCVSSRSLFLVRSVEFAKSMSTVSLGDIFIKKVYSIIIITLRVTILGARPRFSSGLMVRMPRGRGSIPVLEPQSYQAQPSSPPPSPDAHIYLRPFPTHAH